LSKDDDPEKGYNEYSPWPLAASGTNAKAAQVLGDERILRDGTNMPRMVIMTEKSVEVTRSKAHVNNEFDDFDFTEK
jgi:hypothetical protein